MNTFHRHVLSSWWCDSSGLFNIASLLLQFINVPCLGSFTYNRMLQLSLLLWLTTAVGAVHIPLVQAFKSASHQESFQVHFDFQDSHTYVPLRSNILYLEGVNLTLPMLQHENSFVKIGLKYPSDFIVAVGQHYGVKDTEIELAFSPLPKLVLNEVNFVEGRDDFVSGQHYDITVVYNYGRGIRIPHQLCEIIEGDEMFFNEYMILEVLNSMPAENGIRYTRTEENFRLEGKLANFPHLIINHGSIQIPLVVKSNVLKLNAETASNKIGIEALKGYSKVQIREHGIVLKRSSFNIVLYIFLGLFLLFSLVLTLNCRRDV